MAKKLVDLEIDKVAGVDAAANKRTWLIVKRHDEDKENNGEGGENMPKENIDKAGKKISSASMDKLKAAMSAIKALMGMPDDMPKGEIEKGGQMAITEEVIKGLPEEVQKHLEDLEGKVADIEDLQKKADKVDELEAKVEKLGKKEDKEEEVLKGASPEILKKFEDLEKKAADAEELAKSEKELRISKQYNDEAKELDKLGDVGKVAKMLRSADEQGEEFGKQLRETLKSAQSQIDLTKELGRSGSDNETDAESKLEAKADEIAKRDNISKEQAMDALLDTKEGQEIYAQHKEEKGDK